MTQVLHLLDDTGLGGVTRGLPDHIQRLSNGFDHEVMVVNTKSLPPSLPRADIVVIHFTVNWAKLPFMLALRTRLRRARIVIAEHSYTAAYEHLCVPNRLRFRTMLRLNYALADRVVAVSEAQATWLRESGVVPASRLTAIPQALDTSALLRVPPARPQPGPLRLGAYGRYARQKGFDVLIEAMHLVPPTVATLHIRGLGADHDALCEAAAGLPHVTVGDKVVDLPAFFSTIDAVIIPSRWEAYGLVGAEARAAARPVLAAATDGLVEQVDGSLGILFPPENPYATAAAIHALRDRDLTLMGEMGRRSVAGALDALTARWMRVLGDMASPRGQRPSLFGAAAVEQS